MLAQLHRATGASPLGGAGANPPGWVGDIPERHDAYWGSEANMIEGNPMLALERGEALHTPPVLWMQGSPDIVHDYRDVDAGADANEPERFAGLYRAAGGDIDLRYVAYAARMGPASLDPLAAFFHAQLT